IRLRSTASLPASVTSLTLSRLSTTGIAEPMRAACSKQRRIRSVLTRHRTPSCTATTASSSMSASPLATEWNRVSPPPTSRMRPIAPKPSASALPASICASGSTSITCISMSAERNVFTGYHRTGFPPSKMNCLGTADPMRVPAPPATITAYFFMESETTEICSLIDRNPVAALETPVHSLAVEHQRRVPLRVHADHPPLTADGHQLLVHHDVHRLLEAQPLVFHQAADIMRRNSPDEQLAVTRTRNTTGAVVGIGPGADDRAIADPAIFFIGHTARTRGGGDIPLLIAGHGTHGPEFLVPHELLQPLVSMIQRIPVTVPDGFPLIVAELRKEILVRLQLDTLLYRKIAGALPAQKYMIAVRHDLCRKLYGIAHITDTCNRTCRKR